MFARTLRFVLIVAGCCGWLAASEAPHGDTWQQSLERGKQLWTQGQFAQAEIILQSALRLAQASHDKELAVALTLNGLASVYQDLGRFRDAEQSYRRSIFALEKVVGPGAPTLASPLHNLAGLYLETGRYDDAEPLLIRSLSIRTAALGLEHPDVAMTLNSLGALYGLQRKWEKAEGPLQQALGVFRRVFGHGDLHVAEVLTNLGRLYQDTKRYGEALTCFQRVLAIVEKAAASPAFIAKALNNQGALYAAMENPVEAEPYLKRALAVQEESLGLNHPTVAGILSNYASVLRQMKRKPEAKQMEARAKAILARNRPSYSLGHTVDVSELQQPASY